MYCTYFVFQLIGHVINKLLLLVNSIKFCGKVFCTERNILIEKSGQSTPLYPPVIPQKFHQLSPSYPPVIPKEQDLQYHQFCISFQRILYIRP